MQFRAGFGFGISWGVEHRMFHSGSFCGTFWGIEQTKNMMTDNVLFRHRHLFRVRGERNFYHAFNTGSL